MTTMIVSQQEATLLIQDGDHLKAFGTKLDLIRDRTRSVADRYQVGAYIVGRSGSSKTFTVMETLEALEKPWTYRNSRMSAMGLWCLLEEHPEHTVVLDDISTLFEQRGRSRSSWRLSVAPLASQGPSPT